MDCWSFHGLMLAKPMFVLSHGWKQNTYTYMYVGYAITTCGPLKNMLRHIARVFSPHIGYLFQDTYFLPPHIQAR